MNFDMDENLHQILTMNETCIEFQSPRRSGKTTTVMAASIELAKRGKKICIIVQNQPTLEHVCCIVKELTGESNIIKNEKFGQIHIYEDGSFIDQCFDYVFVDDVRTIFTNLPTSTHTVRMTSFQKLTLTILKVDEITV